MSRSVSRMHNEEEQAIKLDNLVKEYSTYEDFLNSQITSTDLYYLEDEEVARDLVELGYRGTGEVLKREEFEARKQALSSNQKKRDQKQTLAGQGYDLTDTPLLAALAQREEANRTGKMTTIIFIRDKNHREQEISGYIDFAHRLKTEDFTTIFSKKKRFIPKQTDLSFYNWDTQQTSMHDTPNYQVIADSTSGLTFKNKTDRKTIDVDPKTAKPGDNTTRLELYDSSYEQIVLFDHFTRR